MAAVIAAAVATSATLPAAGDSAAPLAAPLSSNDCCWYRASGRGETFRMKIARVSSDPEKRAAFWKEVASDDKPVIYQLTFTRTKEWKLPLPKTPEEAIAAVDAFFAPGDGVAPCPERIFAVTPAEENVTWSGQLAVQDALAKHLRSRYGVKTYQWLSEPLKPTLDVQADGWVFDAYCVTDPAAFYEHLESFALTGVPVVPCIWASGKWGGYHRAKTWDALTRYTVERMDMCRAFGMPVMVFAVAGKTGSVGAWFGKTDDPGERYYRETVKNYMASVPTMPEASWKAPAKAWRAAAGEDGKVRAKVDLKSFDLVRETAFDDVRNWRLTKEGLSPADGKGALSWRLACTGRVRGGTFALRHTPSAKGRFCGKPLSPDGLTAVEVGGFDSRLVTFEADGPVALEELSFGGEGEAGEEIVELAMDTSYGRTDYRARIGFGDDAALCGVEGRVATRRIVRRVLLPGHEAGRMIVNADVFAAKPLGGSVAMSVETEGGEVVARAESDPGKTRQTLPLTDDPPDAAWNKQGVAIPPGTEAVRLVFDLKVSCGRDTGCGAKVSSCDFRFRPLHP